MSSDYPFTFDGYRNLIEKLLAKGYAFSAFPDAIELDLTKSQRPLCLMRHDIDFDLGMARDMALVEAEFQIQSTYFFLVRTEHYNLFSEQGTKLVREILDLGHHLGLHFDCASYDSETTVAGFAKYATAEAQMLET
ncbi:MAG: hypothetical protein AAF939_13965, partial [Planctomycetota bacterium]